MTAIINASNTSGITFTSDTSGNVAIQSNGTTVVTIAGTGANAGVQMGAAFAPAFSAYKSTGSGTQSMTTGTFVKITFDTEEFDTNNNFASSRFTPTVAGYYQINSEADIGGSGFITMDIYKNGSSYKRGSGSSGSEVYVVVSSLVYLNGSTDYVEIYGYSLSSTGSVYGSATYTYFQGFLARSA